ncbi:MAG TPA: serine hydrolase [Acidimicrobiia bacterium]|nr:serine hydrolase [Acidimicrobiia bacterium]
MTTVDEVAERAFSQPPELGLTLAMVVAHRGEIVAERYGPGTDATTTLISWSMAKSITHALIGLLVRDGRLDMAAPAPVPRWGHDGDARGAITLDQLLQMRSGLAFVEDYVEGHPSDVIDMLFGSGRDDVAAYAEACELEHVPGTVFNYSSGTTNIVSAIAGRTIGGGAEGVSEYLDRELLAPLGMTSATVGCDAAGTFVGSSYVYATARDFVRFGELYRNDGVVDGRRLLPVGWVDHGRKMTAPPAPPDEPFGYGAHWWVWDDAHGTYGAHGYEGQYTLIVPDLDLVVVRLGKSPVELRPAVVSDLARIITSFA